MASSSSSSSYQVYTSFHEPDVGKTLISPLRKEFDYNGIKMFDDKRIERSQLITPALTQAIRESKVLIIVLSENYASSSWCLDELLEILNAGQIVMTVFYGVNPYDVRYTMGKFGIAFRETCAGRTEEEQRKWSQALTTVANITGVEFKDWNIEDRIQLIARGVSDNLNNSKDFDSMVDVFLSSCCEADGPYFRDILHQNGISIFQSYRCLQTSVIPINQQTLKALEVAKVAVVMMFETKPTVGFLEELRVILEFREKGSLTVIPVLRTHDPFYAVEEEICQQYPENAPSWRTALTKLATIAAQYPFSQNLAGRYQLDRFNQIAHDIFLLLYSTSNDLNGLVAMDRHMKVVYDLLSSQVVNKEVRTIGIWGSAGVGKTTLARHIYAEISVKFSRHVFS